MSSLSTANPACLEYELSGLEKAIEGVAALLIKYSSSPKQFEYYSVMHECMLGVAATMEEIRKIRSQDAKLVRIIELMELLIEAKGVATL